MLILLTGGSGNGKSTLAVELLRKLPEPRFLLDAATVYDETEAKSRQSKQRLLKEQNIDTLPIGQKSEQWPLPHGSNAVLECMCHLTANEMFCSHTMFDPQADFSPVFSRILRKIQDIHHQCETLIIVTNEVSAEGIGYGECTTAYQQLLGCLNTEIARQADCVCEVVCGLPLPLKGTLPYKKRDEVRAMTNQILVIGPENAGKKDYVATLGYGPQDMSDDLYADCPVLLNLQNILLKQPEITPELIELLKQKKVIVCNEVGSGIIPVSKELTQARVLTGTVCSRLAQEASKVIRVLCGIPTILK